MSKDEVKREFKESEGDPTSSGQRKQLHQQMIMEGQVDRSRKATVLVTNPTHVAIAVYVSSRIRHRCQSSRPWGPTFIARRSMIEGRNPERVSRSCRTSRLRMLCLENASLDEYIPSELIEPFAEVLRALRDLVPATE